MEKSRGVSLVGEEEKLVVLSQLNQRVNQPRGMSEVHILINQTVYEHQFALHLVSVSHYAARLVASHVSLRSIHVSLSVVSIIAVLQ